jgi:hypothetical protein
MSRYSAGVGELDVGFTTVMRNGGTMKLVNMIAENERSPCHHEAEQRVATR